MKNLFYLLIFSTITVSFGSCSSNTSDDAWREANWTAYEAITKDTNYNKLTVGNGYTDNNGPTGVYYRVEQSGTGTEYPLQTSKVKVLYKGTYYDGSVFDAGTSGNDFPTEFSLAGTSVVRGFSFALQQMVVGDKWEIWIPYYLGYGSVGLQDAYYNTIIKPYTTLIFEVELVSITQYP